MTINSKKIQIVSLDMYVDGWVGKHSLCPHQSLFVRKAPRCTSFFGRRISINASSYRGLRTSQIPIQATVADVPDTVLRNVCQNDAESNTVCVMFA
jgi:hypothetical protein